MIKCDILRRATGQMSELPFAKGFIVFRDLKYGQTHWVKVSQVDTINEMMVYKTPWRWLIFWRKTKIHELKNVVVINNLYELHNVDVVQFLLECSLAAES